MGSGPDEQCTNTSPLHADAERDAWTSGGVVGSVTSTCYPALYCMTSSSDNVAVAVVGHACLPVPILELRGLLGPLGSPDTSENASFNMKGTKKLN
jgi:hypothetical protein